MLFSKSVVEPNLSPDKGGNVPSKRTEYVDLVIDFAPRAIRSNKENKRALKRVEELQRCEKLSKAQSELLDLLQVLLKDQRNLNLAKIHRKGGTAAVLKTLMEEKGVIAAEVSRESKVPESVISNVLHGRRDLSKSLMIKLSNYFDVSMQVFLGRHWELNN